MNAPFHLKAAANFLLVVLTMGLAVVAFTWLAEALPLWSSVPIGLIVGWLVGELDTRVFRKWIWKH